MILEDVKNKLYYLEDLYLYITYVISNLYERKYCEDNLESFMSTEALYEANH